MGGPIGPRQSSRRRTTGVRKSFAEQLHAAEGNAKKTDVGFGGGGGFSGWAGYGVPAGSGYTNTVRNGVWMEVDDENGNRGWMSSASATPR